MEKSMDKIVSLAKSRGFVYPGSEIYGGLANTWDYGNLGVELKNNVKKAWWQKFIQENPYNVGVDCAILMNPQTWVASGHLGGFADPLMDCKECHERFRADKLIEDYAEEKGISLPKPIDAFSQEEMKAFVEDNNIPCPTCGKHNFTDIRQFNLMFKTFQGVTEDATSPSEPESSSRWNLSSSVSPEQILSGSSTGEPSVVTGSSRSESRRMRCVCVIMILKSFASILREQQILNSSSRSAGASFGVLLTEQTMT